MTTINQQPQGLLGFLGIKNGGRNPGELLGTLSPGWDLEALYLNAAAEISAGAYSIAGIGYQPAFVVPNDQIWRIQGFGVYSNAALGAGVSVRATPAVRDPGGIIVLPLQTVSVTQTTNDLFVTGTEREFYLQPGYSIGLVTSLVAAGPVACTANLRFTRLRT